MAESSTEIEATIRSFILENLEATTDLAYDDRLMDKGYIPSMQLINLVGFLEDTFGVTINPFDVTPDNFESVAAIADLVRTLRGRS